VERPQRPGAKIRAGIPGIALRTTLIVGYPDETPAAFDELLRFVEDVRFHSQLFLECCLLLRLRP
jgi:ribosomal protein S12 methylthiotransferase